MCVDHFDLVPKVTGRFETTPITSLPERPILLILLRLDKNDLINFSLVSQAHHVAVHSFKSFCLAAHFFANPNVQLIDKLTFVENYCRAELGRLEVAFPTIHKLYSILESSIKAAHRLREESPGDPFHSEFRDQVASVFNNPKVKAVLEAHPLTDPLSLEWLQSVGKRGAWSPIKVQGDLNQSIPIGVLEEIVNTDPISLLYRIKEYLPAQQAGTSWFANNYADEIALACDRGLGNTIPFTNPIAITDRKPYPERIRPNTVTCKLPPPHALRANHRRAVPPGTNRPRPNQPIHRNRMEADGAPTQYRFADPDTVRFRFQNALRPQFWLMLLWAVANYRDNPKYLNPQDPMFADRRKRINDLLHEILADPHLRDSVRTNMFLEVYLPAYETHCFEQTSVTSLNQTLTQISETKNHLPLHRWLNRSDPVYDNPELREALVQYWARAERIFSRFLNPPAKFPGVINTKPDRDPKPSGDEAGPSSAAPKPTPQLNNPQPTPSRPTSSNSLRPPPGFNPIPNQPPNQPVISNPPHNMADNPTLTQNTSQPTPTVVPVTPINPAVAPSDTPSSLPAASAANPVQSTIQVSPTIPTNPTQPILPVIQTNPTGPSNTNPPALPALSPFTPVSFANYLLPYSVTYLATIPPTVIPVQFGHVVRFVGTTPTTSQAGFQPVWLHELHRFDYTNNMVLVTRESNATDTGDMVSTTIPISLETYYTTYRPDPAALVTRVTVQPPLSQPYLPT